MCARVWSRRKSTARLSAKSSSRKGSQREARSGRVPGRTHKAADSPSSSSPARPPPEKNKTKTKQLVEALGVDPALVQKKLQANQALIGAFFEGTGPGTLRFYHQVGF